MQIGGTSEDCDRGEILENVDHDQGRQADAGEPPPPASFHKEHDHQAEQGVRRDERKVKRNVGVEKTHEPLAIRERPGGSNHPPALLRSGQGTRPARRARTATS